MTRAFSFKSILPASFRAGLYRMREKVYISALYRRIFMQRKVGRIRKKSSIRVLFISISPAIWKVDSLYRAMQAHPRFEATILVAPNMVQSNEQIRLEDYQNLKTYFEGKGYVYEEWYGIGGETDYPRIPAAQVFFCKIPVIGAKFVYGLG